MAARLIIGQAANGPWNMAVDEALFATLPRGSGPVLRFYQWSQPTLSLGYFQKWRLRDEHPASRTISLVRRSTGGGAIVHDRELTYSLVINLPDCRPATTRAVMTAIHESLISLLSEAGILARLATQADKSHSPNEPFLCFQRRTPGDIVVQGHKVLGSAQRRQGATLLQHGSLLLRRSDFAPELPGLSDLSPECPTAESLTGQWAAAIGKILAVEWLPSELTAVERGAAAEIEREKFAADRWNLKR